MSPAPEKGFAARNRLPTWFKQDLPGSCAAETTRLLRALDVHTVCQEAHCPNLGACFKKAFATFLLLGDTCTRSCRFCAVKKSQKQNLVLDLDEPRRIAQAVIRLKIKYVVLTSVTRDDLPDGGAGIFAGAIEEIRRLNSNIKVEVLIPDFLGVSESIKTVVAARPSLIAHNLETVPRLYHGLREQSNYQRSLDVLAIIKENNPDLATKSSLMLGLGEKKEEVEQAMRDLREVNCDILVLGQYLAPSPQHYRLREFIDVAEFQEYSKIALGLGFKAVLAHPLARSSYRAQEVFLNASHI